MFPLSAVYFSFPGLKRRSRRKPVTEPGSYPCERCGKEYGYRKNMLQHLRYECGMEPQFRCPQCVRRFRRNSHLRSHIFSKHPPEVVMECLAETDADAPATSCDLPAVEAQTTDADVSLASYGPPAPSSAPVSPFPSATPSPLTSTPPASPASLF
ncbi:hypothetical protein FOCC_FOCC005473 [Frankliniella occidentalis]|nr:hypothetical protein FOCC_FOCC005473 [Frankliniella occidentalis]